MATTFAVEFGRAKTVAAFLVTELAAVGTFFAGNLTIARIIAIATALLTTLVVYVVPNPIKGAVIADATVLADPGHPLAGVVADTAARYGRHDAGPDGGPEFLPPDDIPPSVPHLAAKLLAAR